MIEITASLPISHVVFVSPFSVVLKINQEGTSCSCTARVFSYDEINL